MNSNRHARLLAELAGEYARHAPASAALNDEAKRWLVDGGSHALRLIEPFPPRIVVAKGAWIEDEDGHRVLDFWQGHYANILGHNSEVIASALACAFEERFGLETGFTDRLQVECAEILCRQTGAERVRFTTSGSLATMYATLLARSYTGRDLVMKAGGGWHGAQPWGLKGVSFDAESREAGGFQQVETHGLPTYLTEEVIVTDFNDSEALRDHFRQHGDELACFIVEPFMGVGGFMPAEPEYLETARQLADEYGTLLIFDEVIDGFRFRAGDVGRLYGVQPDLATFGKAMGGGMPVSAVAGRADVMGLVGRERGRRVKFSGGTYSAHPASLLAAKTSMTYLIEHEEQVYPRLAELGARTRRTIEAAFRDEGIYARCTGYGNEAVPGGSLVMTHFPREEGRELTKPGDVSDPEVCDVTLRERVLKLGLLLEDVHVVHGLGALSLAHTEDDIARLGEACRRVARRVKPHL
ncbi:MAG: aminotransferase class III-fold pyridoxal phosphate-dependent enzyme [Anaerolineae bacterium]|jgi:glutamate-1-semialdehyde 2,1-aminomutase